MVTRCPSCDTMFRVTPQHLQAYHGQVRCGRCMTVFDGFKGLATLPDQGAPEPKPRSAVEGASDAGDAIPVPMHAEAAPIPADPVAAIETAIPGATTAIVE